MNFLISRHYQVVTEASAVEGDVAESGTIADREEMTLRDVVEQLRDMDCTSSYPIRSAGDCEGTWTFTHDDIDYITGDSRSESLHIMDASGKRLSGRNLLRLYRLASLVDIDIPVA